MKKQKKPEVVESSKKLLVISPCPNNPAVSPLIALFLGIKKNAVKHTDKDGIYQPTTSNASVSNGKLEALMKRLDCSLFAYIYSNKSNVPRIIVGRTFEYEIVDLTQYSVTHSLPNINMLTNSVNVLLVHRDPYVTDVNTLNLIMDLLRDSVPAAIGLGLIKYGVGLNVSKERITIDVLEFASAPFKISSIAGPVHLDIMEEHRMNYLQQKESSKQIRQTEKKIKNVEKSILNSTLGVLHLEKQDLREIQLSKGKALRNISKK